MNSRIRTFALGCLTAALALTTAFSPQALAAKKKTPNVVVIFMDDMAYADIGPFGATAYPTPHLDRMAKEGRKFTDFYVTQAVCSASRAMLVITATSAKSPWRLRNRATRRGTPSTPELSVALSLIHI